MANIIFLEAGGASTGGTELWDAISGTWSVDTSIKPPDSYSSLRGSNTTLQANVLQNAGRISSYFRFEGYPVGSGTILQLFDGSGTSARIQLNSDGTLRITDGT